MKDLFNIVKVSDIHNVDCEKIIKKCSEKPNLINYYYPHIFMNRDKINNEDLTKILTEHVINIHRDKNVDHTIKKYNTLTSILETLFLCVLDIVTIKNIHKLIQYQFSNDENNITDLVNHMIQDQPLYNLEQLINDKIDNTHSIYIIEKIIEHVRKNYTDSNLEKQTILQYQIISNIQQYILKQKYIPYLNKITNFNKKEIIKDYINNCIINESHDNYIMNIIDLYQEFKSTSYDIDDNCDWTTYFKKVNSSLNIDDQKEKVIKCIFRFNILNKIIQNYKDKSNHHDSKNYVYMNNINNINVIKNNLHTNLQTFIDNNNIDKIITNSYINMVKNHCAPDKLLQLENIIKYFSNYSTLSNRFIDLIIPKYFAKENTVYYMNIYNKLNILCNKKLSIVDTIIEQQKKYSDDLKITHVENESKSIFDINIISIFNIDHKFVKSSTKNITNYMPELKAYNTFTQKWFENNFSNLKKITIDDYMSNGKLQISNTIIKTNLIMLNTMFMFNNDSKSFKISDLNEKFSEDVIEHIIATLEYYNLAYKQNSTVSDKQNSTVSDKQNDTFVLNSVFFDTKQEIKVELIKKSSVQEPVLVQEKTISNLQEEVIECIILKTIKPIFRIAKDTLFNTVSSKCNFNIDQTLFDKCMKRLFDLDYYEVVDNQIMYVP